MKIRSLWTGVLGLLAGCCGAGPDYQPNHCQERHDVAQGIYGQVWNGCATQGCQPTTASGVEVRVYNRDPRMADGSDRGTQLTPMYVAASDPEGLYRFALASGSYYLCLRDAGCLATSLVAGGVQRQDWVSAPDGGHWLAGCAAQ